MLFIKFRYSNILFYIVVICAISVLLLLSGCSKKDAKQPLPVNSFSIQNPRVITRTETAPSGRRGGTLRYATFGEPKTFNPTMANETSSTDITNRIFSSLLTLNYKTLKIEGDLAENWSESKDALTVTFTLREGLRWSDGHLLTADDILFTFQVVYDPKIASANRDSALINGKPVNVIKIDDHTIKMILPEPYAAFFHSIGAGIQILPKHKLEEAYKNGTFPSAYSLKTAPAELVGSGPFRLLEFRAGERVIIERNPYYYAVDKNKNRLPYLDRLVFITVPDFNVMLLKFLSGESDIFPTYPPKFHEDLEKGKKVGNYTLIDLGVVPASNFLFFNMNPAKVDAIKWKWFTNKKFRQAIAHAIDKESMIRLIYMGKARECYEFHPVSPWYNPNTKKYKYDLNKAKEFLIEAGFHYKDNMLYDSDGNRVSFSLLTNSGNNDRVATGNIIKEDLTKLGMDVTFRPIDFNTLISKLNSTFDWEASLLALTGHSSAIEPALAKNVWMSSGFTHMWFPQQKSPATPWEAEIDKLTIEGARTGNISLRKNIYNKIQDIFAEEVPMIYTVTRSSLFAINNRIGNADLTIFSGLISSSDDTDLASMLYIKGED